jgi:uncharacterized repeat protein (TIGR02543 family)
MKNIYKLILAAAALPLALFACSDGGSSMPARVANPVFNPPAGTVEYGTKVKMSCETHGAEIWYTLDATKPSNGGNGSVFYHEKNPITITDTITVTAVAVKDGMQSSATVTEKYLLAGPSLSMPAVKFDSVLTGYAQPAAKDITIKNDGTETAAVSGITLGGTDPSSFILGGNLAPVIEAGKSAVITVQPKAGLGAETYSATITAAYSGGVLKDRKAVTEVFFKVGLPVVVTFDSNGGSAVAPINMVQGDRLTAPAPPTKAGYECKFDGWYVDPAFTDKWNFNSPVNAHMTLYAKWGGAYILGDTGPGGGKIIYVKPSGFTNYTNAADTIGTTCWYLEAAPSNLGTLAWASAAFIPPAQEWYRKLDYH